MWVMSAIQYLLLLLLLLLGLVYVRLFRHSLLKRSVMLLVFASGAFLVIQPDTTTVVANWLGVQRGVDLLFYLCIILFGFIVAGLYRKIRLLEARQTELIRELAIKALPDSEDAAPDEPA